MVKTYSPFIEVTRTDEVEGLSTISLINVDYIIHVQCLDDGRAKLYFHDINTAAPQFMVPVENYAHFVNLLTELTQFEAEAQPAKKRRAPRKRKPTVR